MLKNFIETHAKILRGEVPIFEILIPKTKDLIEIYYNSKFVIIINGKTPKFPDPVIVKNRVPLLLKGLIKSFNKKKDLLSPHR